MPTRSGLRTIVRQDELLNSTDVISDANLNLLLEESAIQFARDGHPFITQTTWNTAASTSAYVLSGASPKVTGFLDIYWPAGGLIYAQTSAITRLPGIDFSVVSEDWLHRNLAGWRDLAASDTLRHAFLSYNSSGYLTLNTVPKASTATPAFTLWAISSGTVMSADANYPYVNDTTALAHIEPFTKAIAYWAMHVLHRDKTKLAGEAERYLQLYSGLAKNCQDAQERILWAEIEGLRQRGQAESQETFGGL